MTKTFRRGAIATVVAVALGVVSASAGAQTAAPSRQWCDYNRVESEQAASAATQATVNADRAVVGVAAGGGCWLFSVMVGFTDLGSLTGACAAVGALVSMTTAPDEAAAKAQQAYIRHRAPECIAAYGR